MSSGTAVLSRPLEVLYLQKQERHQNYHDWALYVRKQNTLGSTLHAKVMGVESDGVYRGNWKNRATESHVTLLFVLNYQWIINELEKEQTKELIFLNLPTLKVCLVGTPRLPFLSLPLTENTCKPCGTFSPVQTPAFPLPQSLKSAPSREHKNCASSCDVQVNRGLASVTLSGRLKVIAGALLSVEEYLS